MHYDKQNQFLATFKKWVLAKKVVKFPIVQQGATHPQSAQAARRKLKCIVLINTNRLTKNKVSTSTDACTLQHSTQ